MSDKYNPKFKKGDIVKADIKFIHNRLEFVLIKDDYEIHPFTNDHRLCIHNRTATILAPYYMYDTGHINYVCHYKGYYNFLVAEKGLRKANFKELILHYSKRWV